MAAQQTAGRGGRRRGKVQCPNCGTDVSVLRDVCPRCGTPVDAALRGPRFRTPGPPGPRPEDELKRNRKTVLIVCGAIVAVLAVGGRLSGPFHPIRIALHEPRKGPVATDAETLYSAYRADPDAAARRFARREIIVSGEFLRTVPDGYGSIDMRLKTSNPEAPLGVDLARESVDDAKLLRPGQQVTVSCRRVWHTGDEHWLENCAIQPGGNAGAAPAAPSPAPVPSPPPPPRVGNSG
jgi:hypothetical protein